MDPGDGHAAGLQRDHEEDQVPLEPGQREHLDGEPIAGREALPVRLQERLPGHAPAPLGSRVDPVVVQDPLHRGPSDLVAEVRERPADPCVPPLGMLDRHPDHERGAATSRRVIGRPRPRRALPAYVWAINLRYQRRIVSGVGDSTMPATCIVVLLRDAPSELLAAHGEVDGVGHRSGTGEAAEGPGAPGGPDSPPGDTRSDRLGGGSADPASERENEEL